jgi:hypothetical protein
MNARMSFPAVTTMKEATVGIDGGRRRVWVPGASVSSKMTSDVLFGSGVPVASQSVVAFEPLPADVDQSEQCILWRPLVELCAVECRRGLGDRMVDNGGEEILTGAVVGVDGLARDAGRGRDLGHARVGPLVEHDARGIEDRLDVAFRVRSPPTGSVCELRHRCPG